MSEMDAIVKEFLEESNENLDQLDGDLVELERNPTSKELLARVFRTVHSIKGATGFLGFEKLGKVAHVGESLLSRLRDGVVVLDPEITSGLLSLVDAIRRMLSEIEEKGQEGNADYTALVDTLTRLQEEGQVGKAPPVPATSGAEDPNSSGAKADACDTLASPGVFSQAGSAARQDGQGDSRQIDRSHRIHPRHGHRTGLQTPLALWTA